MSSALAPRVTPRRTSSAEPTNGSQVRELLLIASVAALFVAIRVRLSGDAFDHIWAEDGKVFLEDARNHGLNAFAYTYSGYAHFLPRLTAALTTAVPLQYASVVFALVPILATGTSSACIYKFATNCRLTKSRALIAALCLPLLPIAGIESLGNTANLQWTVLPAAFWALLAPGTTSPKLAITVVLLSALTTPLTLLVTPALLVHGREALKHPALTPLATGLAIQLLLIGFGPHSTLNPYQRHQNSSSSSGLRAYFSEVSHYTFAIHVSSMLFTIGAGLAFVITVIKRRGGAAGGYMAAISSAAILLVTTAVQGAPNPRYVYVSTVLLISAIVLLRPGYSKRITSALTLSILLLVASSFPVIPERSNGPSWSDSVVQHEQACGNGAESSVAFLNPPGWDPMILQCTGSD